MPSGIPNSSIPSFRATELAYGGIQAYQNDKDAGRTNLDYRYWLAARTPEFKAEFGPWEQLRAQIKVQAMGPIQVPWPSAWAHLSLEAVRKRMADTLAELKGDERKGKLPVPILHPEIGAIIVGKSGIGKSRSSSGDPAKIVVAAQITSLIPQAIYSHSEPLSKVKSNSQIVGYSTLLAKVQVEDLPLIGVFTIERKTDGNWYYNTVVLQEEKEKTREFQIDGLTRTSLVQVAPLAGLTQRQRTPLDVVKPDFISKELDAETGEPTASAIRKFLDLSLNLGDSDKKQEFQQLSNESQKLIQTARALRQAYHAETRKEGKFRVLEFADGASKEISGPGVTAIPLRAALKAFIAGKGGEQRMREFALAHDRAISRSRELTRGKGQGVVSSLGIEL